MLYILIIKYRFVKTYVYIIDLLYYVGNQSTSPFCIQKKYKKSYNVI